jgi:cytochrome c oxidase subunit 2
VVPQIDGKQGDRMNKTINAFIMAAALAMGAVGTGPALAQAAEAPVAAAAANDSAPAANASAAGPAYEHLKPTKDIGMPKDAGTYFQEQFSPTGHYAYNMHTWVLMPVITVIAIFVLLLLLYVIVAFRRKEGREPSKTSHNTLIEILWTALPVLILIGVAIPSIDLLAKQFKPAPKGALTVKITGYQWYWGYEYPDNGIPEYVSNMLPPEKAKANGEPVLLGADNRLVLPVGVPIKLIITGADVIHSFSVPAFWLKEDAVPGRLNERTFTIEKQGVYYGQCSELCGDRHGFMPIAVEAVSPEKFKQWIHSQGGKMPGEGDAAAAVPAAAAAPAAAESNAAAPVAAPAKS